MAKVKINLKWGKENFSDVEVDLAESPMVFKSQIFALTSVPPDRQKVMIKGGLLKDDDWGKQQPKEGSTVMVMGSADAKLVEAPKDAPVFIEDLPEDQQENMETRAYGCGLENLGNTCYMNSTLQCLYSVEPLRDALISASPSGPGDASTKLLRSTKELFSDMKSGGAAFAPMGFLHMLREKFPQFAQQGREGAYMQQDAEECWTNLLYTLKEKLKGEGSSESVDEMLGIGTRLKLKCEESGEEMDVDTPRSYMLKCNIDVNTNHVHEGLLLGMVDDRERHSAALDRTALYKGSSNITSLPSYLTVQMVRFFYKAAAQQKAKVLRKVSFGMELDVYDLCAPELKLKLDGPRAALKEHQDLLLELSKKALAAKKASVAAVADKKDAPAAPAPIPAAAATADVDMADAAAAASSSGSQVGALTGKYELTALLTHKGRSADSGHYVAWVKQKDGRWVLFDDDTLSFKKDEDIIALSGGGDWHMAYMMMYRAVRVPPPPATEQA